MNAQMFAIGLIYMMFAIPIVYFEPGIGGGIAVIIIATACAWAGQILFCKLIEHQTEGGFWFSMLR
jgi:hypothetical protein